MGSCWCRLRQWSHNAQSRRLTLAVDLWTLFLRRQLLLRKPRLNPKPFLGHRLRLLSLQCSPKQATGTSGRAWLMPDIIRCLQMQSGAPRVPLQCQDELQVSVVDRQALMAQQVLPGCGQRKIPSTQKRAMPPRMRVLVCLVLLRHCPCLFPVLRDPLPLVRQGDHCLLGLFLLVLRADILHGVALLPWARMEQT